MPYPVTESASDIDSLAKNLNDYIRACHAACVRAKAENNNDIYGAIIDIPVFNKRLQDHIAAIHASGQSSRVVTQLNALLPNDVTIADAQSFADAFNSLANDIESNDTLFIMTINATSKHPEFVTPVSASVKSIISTRIDAVLSEVS